MAIAEQLRQLERAQRKTRETADAARRDQGEPLVREAAGGASGMIIQVVKTLPDLPSNPKIVWWTSSDGGTGDDQLWAAGPNSTQWLPLMKFTTKSGA